MFSLEGIGRMLVFFGIVIVFAGLLFLLAGKIPFLGRLPGDIAIHNRRFHFYFPLATCLLVSVVLTFIVNFFLRHK
ncbi:MAG: DUF2905 domain-containing protein [Candidatus Omnitrophica bacterium]|nr:DUF2905 domain-containing protein [Candidatus Omnitrophota bacterium]MDD3275360.1 DUF2905 domain-containing protein [Candidatus Omnitrophota bacterium]